MQLIFICLLLKQHVLTVHKQPEISVSQSECDGLKKDGSGLQGQLQSQFEDSLCSKGKEKKKRQGQYTFPLLFILIKTNESRACSFHIKTICVSLGILAISKLFCVCVLDIILQMR